MLKHRILSGIFFIAIFGVSVFWNSVAAPIIFMALSCTLLKLAFDEFFQMTQILGYPGFPKLTGFFGILLFVATGLLYGRVFVSDIPNTVVENTLVWGFVVSAIICVFRDQNFECSVMNLLASAGGFLCIAWTLAFLIKIYFIGNGPLLVFYLILTTKSADIGGYAVGRITGLRVGGNRKLVPAISPMKSWEGLIGGIALSILVSCSFVYLLGGKLMIAYPAAILLGFILTLLGLVGDLSISVFKRATKLKDSGTSLPGFGGVLDLLDSLLFVPPIFYCFISLN